MQVLDSYIRWYNEKRIKLSLGSLSPIEYRESLEIAAYLSPSFCPHDRVVKARPARTAVAVLGIDATAFARRVVEQTLRQCVEAGDDALAACQPIPYSGTTRRSHHHPHGR